VSQYDLDFLLLPSVSNLPDFLKIVLLMTLMDECCKKLNVSEVGSWALLFPFIVCSNIHLFESDREREADYI
jgi:hypothetical protein